MRNGLFTAILIIGFLMPEVLLGQRVDNQLWLNYAVSVPLNSKLRVGGDAGLRGLISNQEWNQVLVRPTVAYSINSTFSVAGALAWFNTRYRNDTNANEFRTHQDLNISWPDLNIVHFFSRLRFEQRWFFYKNLDNDFDFRLRYLIGAESKDFRLFNWERPFYLQIIYEGFQTLDDNAVEVFINRTRLHAAFGHRISKNFRYEFHYISQTSRQFVETGSGTTQNIFRIRLFHKIQP
jgi:hypothetical protein